MVWIRVYLQTNYIMLLRRTTLHDLAPTFAGELRLFSSNSSIGTVVHRVLGTPYLFKNHQEKGAPLNI